MTEDEIRAAAAEPDDEPTEAIDVSPDDETDE